MAAGGSQLGAAAAQGRLIRVPWGKERVILKTLICAVLRAGPQRLLQALRWLLRQSLPHACCCRLAG